MLGSLRTSGKGKGSNVFIWIIMAFLGIGLVGYAFIGVASGLASQNVASVGTQKVDRQDYLRTLETSIQRLSQQFGMGLTMEQARAFGIDQQVLRQMITQAALEGEAAKLGVSAGDDAVREQLLSLPEFQGPGGGFSADTYEFTLERSGLSAPEYEEQVRGDLSRTILEAGVSGGVVMHPAMAETLLKYAGEERSFSYVILTTAQLPEPIGEPTEDDLRRFYEENPEAYTLPEARAVTYIALTTEDMAETIEISDEAIREAYEQQTSRFNTPEQRVLDRIVFGTEEDAAAAKARLDANEIGFDALAIERGLLPGDIEIGARPANRLSSAERDVVFGAEGPGIVGPVSTDLGPALYRINAILAERNTPFAEAAETLRAELATNEAGAAVGQEIDPAQDLLAGGAPLEEIAEETPLILGTIEISERLGEGLAADPAFRAEALDAEVGEERDLIDIGGGGIAALRVDEVIPPRLQTYEEVAETLSDDWRVVAEQVAVRDYANSLLENLNEARTFSAVMQEAGLGVSTTEPTRRGVPVEGLPPGILEPVFALEESGTEIFEDTDATYIIRLEEITPFDPAAEENAGELEATQAAISNSTALDVFNGFAQGAQNAAGVSVNQDLINQSLALYP